MKFDILDTTKINGRRYWKTYGLLLDLDEKGKEYCVHFYNVLYSLIKADRKFLWNTEQIFSLYEIARTLYLKKIYITPPILYAEVTYFYITLGLKYSTIEILNMTNTTQLILKDLYGKFINHISDRVS